jgi:hypothetical protein
MEISGKVTQVLPLVTGEGKNGTWQKQQFVIETQSQYPKMVMMTLWGDKINQYNLSVGMMVTCSVEIESREFNGKWYTDVKAWKISVDQPGGSTPKVATDNSPLDSLSDSDMPFDKSQDRMIDDNDLPF